MDPRNLDRKEGIMKCLLAVVLIASILLIGCGQSKVINGVERKPVGIISMNTDMGTYSKHVHYEPCWGNIIWGAILVETIIAPIYFYGFSMFNPVSVKDTAAANK
jgi:hypothetical protein